MEWHVGTSLYSINANMDNFNRTLEKERSKLSKTAALAFNYGATEERIFAMMKQDKARSKYGDYQMIEAVKPRGFGEACAQCGCIITRDEAPRAVAATNGIVHQWCAR